MRSHQKNNYFNFHLLILAYVYAIRCIYVCNIKQLIYYHCRCKISISLKYEIIFVLHIETLK